MLTSAAEAVQTAAASTANNEAAIDPDIFAKELGSWLATGKTSDAGGTIRGVMEKLASAVPGITVSSRNMSSFAEVGGYYVETGLDANVNISADMMAQMAGDEELFTNIKNIIAGLFSAGENQNLVNAGGSSSTANINITSSEIRYVEVQRGGGNSTMSVASLLVETQNMMAETLQKLLASIASRNSGSFSNNFNIRNQGETRNWNRNFNMWSQSRGQNGSFNNLVDSTSSWRFEMMFNSASAANQTLRSQQSYTTTLEVSMSRFYAEGGSSGTGMDLYTYMEVNGLIDPLVFDLGDEGINLTSAEDGVYFDMRGDGTPVQTAFIKGNNAFLYLDRNGNGTADDIGELFGDHGGHANGFENLRRHDDNRDGVIDENDAIYSQLRLWRDLNGDGVNQAGESLTLADAGIKSINLDYDKDRELDEHGNVIGETSSFTRADGSQGLVADVWLKNRK
jgi:hypothetical protein